MDFSFEEAFEVIVELILVSGMIFTVLYFFLNIDKYV